MQGRGVTQLYAIYEVFSSPTICRGSFRFRFIIIDWILWLCKFWFIICWFYLATCSLTIKKYLHITVVTRMRMRQRRSLPKVHSFTSLVLLRGQMWQERTLKKPLEKPRSSVLGWTTARAWHKVTCASRSQSPTRPSWKTWMASSRYYKHDRTFW